MAKKFRELIEKMPADRQARIERRAEELLVEMPLQAVREARNLSQQHLASRMNQSQSAVSRLERRTDMYISTLRSYIQALGGSLDIVARFPEGSVRIDQFTELSAGGTAEPGAD